MTFELATIARSSLVLAIGFLLLTALRRQPAAVRHLILAAAILLAAAQPIANLVMPSWFVPAFWQTSSSALVPAAEPRVDTAIAFEMIAPATQPASTLQPAVVGMWTWAAGAAIGLAGMAAALVWLIWLGYRGQDAGGEWSTIAAQLSRDLAIQRPVCMRITRHPAVLATWGVIRPIVLLPSDAASWPAERIRVVLAHELAHVARRDWLVHVIAEMARAVYWFNPLFWIACARLRGDSEHACDDIVIEHGIARTSYAAHLVDLARAFRVHGRTWLPAPTMARPSTLERRIRIMLNPPTERRPLTFRSRAAIVAVLLAVALPIAAASRGAGAPSGVLRDPSGRVLPGATVRLSAVGQDVIHEAQTDSTGSFQFPEIPDGDYMLSARLPGFLSSRQRIRVTSPMAPLNVAMQVGTLRETVTVRSDGSPSGAVTSLAERSMPSPPPCGTTEVGGNLKPPLKLKDVRPIYKPELAANNVDGDVLLQAAIGVDGKVRGIEVVSAADHDLEEAAIRAVSQWEFSPTYLNCQAIEVRMFVTVSFKLDR
jgi:TonB family protein